MRDAELGSTRKRSSCVRGGGGAARADDFARVTRGKRRGFTLVEMLVALAVTVVALGIITIVFDVTTRTATQAAASAEVQTLLRNFMLQIEEDLKYCDPADSILVLVGRTQAAALNQDDLDARKFYRVLTGDPNNVPGNFDPVYTPGPVDPLVTQYSDPRADILMFFSNRPSSSQAPPSRPLSGSPGEAYLAGAKFAPIQVVYGHAAFDTAVARGSSYEFADELRHIEQTIGGGRDPFVQSGMPANRWHLARRATIIEPDDEGKIMFTFGSNSELTRTARCYSDQVALAGDVARLDMAALLNAFSGLGLVSLQRGPYVFPLGWGGARNVIDRLMYVPGRATDHHVATILETPPADLRSNLGVHMLPGCVWFQVEFLMPEDPRNGLDSPLADQRNDMPRWVEVEPGRTYVFVPDTAANRELVAGLVDASGTPYGRLADFAQVIPPGSPYNGANTAENREVRMWPYAIRITVRVYDGKSRLEEPVVRSLVHRFD